MKHVSSFFLLGIFLTVPSGIGLYKLITERLPGVWERGALYFLVILLFTGVALPLIALLYRAFSPNREIDASAIVRESLAVGIIAAILLWFQIGRALTPGVIFLAIGGFAAIEILIRTGDLFSENDRPIDQPPNEE